MPEHTTSPAGRLLIHAALPVGRSPSRLPLQAIVSEEIGSTSLYVGQQWLAPGDRVMLHTHPVEEALTFLAGSGEATLGADVVPIAVGTSLYIPAGVVHGFRNTGEDSLHVMVVFPTPAFAETTMVEQS
ncbi:MAG: cupin domain-containing protein [Thermomicrobiales bacterium]